MRTVDAVHLALMLAALAIAYLVPFELLLLSYVVLGPAHYLTEISWLHDRKYFLPPHRGIPLALVAIAVVAALIDNASWFGLTLWLALVVCAILTATSGMQSALITAVAVGVTVVLATSGVSLAVLGILLPTLIHVSLFTLVFMTLGAYRSGSKAQALLVLVYLAAIGLILGAPPSAETHVPAFAAAGQEYFSNVGPALGRLLGIAGLTLDTRLTSLLAFVYTYHYLNWFIKAEVIRWADIPRPRLLLVITGCAASTALYFYNYALGFTILLALSLVHVVLEFPLNSLALRQLGAAIRQSFGLVAHRRA